MTPGPYSLVGDIGGTNVRFALVGSGGVIRESAEVLACRNYNTVADAIADYLEGSGVKAVHQACFAVASSVQGTKVKMTNSSWQFDSEQVRRQFGWGVFKVINDFTAMALGVLHVGSDNLIHVCGGPGDASRPRLVIGPGTGLGVSGLVPAQKGWVPLISEGGHVDFAPTDDTEMAILKILQRRFGRVSVERILSGQGLLNLYRAHAEIQGKDAPLDEPEKITAAALNQSDAMAQQTLQHFFEILGRVAGDGALTLGATGGVYLCGGILPAVIDGFRESAFQNGFEDKGRRRYLLESTPVYVVMENYTGLMGAAAALANPEV